MSGASSPDRHETIILTVTTIILTMTLSMVWGGILTLVIRRLRQPDAMRMAIDRELTMAAYEASNRARSAVAMPG